MKRYGLFGWVLNIIFLLTACQEPSTLGLSPSLNRQRLTLSPSVSPPFSPSVNETLSTPLPSPRPLSMIPPAKKLDHFLMTTVVDNLIEESGRTPRGMLLGQDGSVYISEDRFNHIVRISPFGEITPIAGLKTYERGHQDGPKDQARFSSPGELIQDSQGNLYVNEDRRIRKITPSGIVSTLAGDTRCCGFLGDVQPVDGLGKDARFVSIQDLAIGHDDMIYLIDTDSSVSYVRKVSPDGQVVTITGGKHSDEFSDGSLATAKFRLLSSLTIDSHHDIYVIDNFDRVRKIAANGQVSTLFKGCITQQCQTRDGALNDAIFIHPQKIRSDHQGNLYIAERDDRQLQLRKIDTLGQVTTLFKRGFPAYSSSLEPQFRNGKLTEAQFGNIHDIAFDKSTSELYFLDDYHVVRRLTQISLPIVRQITPRSGKWNTQITLGGYNLDYVTEVKIADIPTHFKVTNPEELVLDIPSRLGKIKSTIALVSPSATYRVEIPFELEADRREIAQRNPYTGPLTLEIYDPLYRRKGFIFHSQKTINTGLVSRIEVVWFDPNQPSIWPSIFPDKAGFRHQAIPESIISSIGLNEKIPSTVRTGHARVSLKEPIQENKLALEQLYHTKIIDSPDNSYLVIPDLTTVDLGKLEGSLRTLNAIMEDPKSVIYSASFDSLEAAKTYAFIVELLLNEQVKSADFNPIVLGGSSGGVTF